MKSMGLQKSQFHDSLVSCEKLRSPHRLIFKKCSFGSFSWIGKNEKTT